jgi:hypothetical protein
MDICSANAGARFLSRCSTGSEIFGAGIGTLKFFVPGSMQEFEQFENWICSERLIEREQFLGAYYEKVDPGSEEGLVLS